MRRYLFIFFSLILAIVWYVSGPGALAAEDCQIPESQKVKDEETEIKEILEMLELMEMLEDFELMKDYHLFAEEETDEKEN